MSLTTLYGMGATHFSDDKATYQARNGVLQVPEHLVPRALNAGFARHPLPTMDVVNAPEPQPAAQSFAPPDAHPQQQSQNQHGKRR